MNIEVSGWLFQLAVDKTWKCVSMYCDHRLPPWNPNKPSVSGSMSLVTRVPLEKEKGQEREKDKRAFSEIIKPRHFQKHMIHISP